MRLKSVDDQTLAEEEPKKVWNSIRNATNRDDEGNEPRWGWAGGVCRTKPKSSKGTDMGVVRSFPGWRLPNLSSSRSGQKTSVPDEPHSKKDPTN
jgi:hypothetical protein